MTGYYHSVKERLKYNTDYSGDCWIWKSGTYKSGYGQIRGDDGKYHYIHRLIFQMYNGKNSIPSDMVIDHTCRNRRCFKLDHLRLVSRKINANENTSNSQRWFFGTCKRGHDMSDPKNVYVRSDGAGHMCRPCASLRKVYGVRDNIPDSDC